MHERRDRLHMEAQRGKQTKRNKKVKLEIKMTKLRKTRKRKP